MRKIGTKMKYVLAAAIVLSLAIVCLAIFGACRVKPDKPVTTPAPGENTAAPGPIPTNQGGITFPDDEVTDPPVKTDAPATDTPAETTGTPAPTGSDPTGEPTDVPATPTPDAGEPTAAPTGSNHETEPPATGTPDIPDIPPATRKPVKLPPTRALPNPPKKLSRPRFRALSSCRKFRFKILPHRVFLRKSKRCLSLRGASFLFCFTSAYCPAGLH